MGEKFVDETRIAEPSEIKHMFESVHRVLNEVRQSVVKAFCAQIDRVLVWAFYCDLIRIAQLYATGHNWSKTLLLHCIERTDRSSVDRLTHVVSD